MAIYKLFPKKDTFVSKTHSTQNFGRDEILEISNETELTSINADVKRSLIQFETSQINNIINNIVSGSYQTNLKLFLANATIPSDYTIFSYPISQSWNMGLGKSADTPITTTGVTWNSLPTYNTEYSGSQNFLYPDNKDIDMDITSIINQWESGSINNGLILKLSSNIEDSTTPLITKFFSMDTHTIYPPHLEFKWDDSSYSSSLTQINSSQFSTSIINNKTEFKENSIYNFRIKSRDTYLTRSFQTSSVYLNNKSLPPTSYWSLRDVKTKETIIDFDLNYTKISCDNTSNYFKLYMGGLEPERYYQIVYKTHLPDGEVVIIDNKSNYFKVVR